MIPIRLYSGAVSVTYSHDTTLDIDIPTAWDMTFIGLLPDAISCDVHEEKNGAYELSMTYVSTGTNADKIATDCILSVYCPLRDSIGENYFRIYRIDRDLGGRMTISARQIAGDLMYFGATKHGTDDPDGILVFADTYPYYIAESFTAWLRHASNMRLYFTFGGDAAFSSLAPGSGHYMDFCTGASVRAYLGGEELQGNDRTALQLFSGCAYVWDKWDISLWKNRGQARDVQITYGTNMAAMGCEDDTDGIYTYVCAFYLKNDGTNFRKYVSSLYATNYVNLFAHGRIKMLDCSAEVTNKYPEGASTATITAYLNNLAEAERDAMNYAGVPVRTISIDVVEAAISGVYLCDTLPVLYKRNGIELNTRMEIVSYTWDVIMQRYTEITLGAVQQDLAKEIVKNGSKSAVAGIQSNVATLQEGYARVAGNVATLQSDLSDLADDVAEIIVATDSGGSGRYTKAIKFSDGTMIATIQVDYSGAISTQWGAMYYSSAISLGSWPVAFTGTPYVTIGLRANTDCLPGAIKNTSATSAGSTYVYRPASTTSATCQVIVTAIGKWQ